MRRRTSGATDGGRLRRALATALVLPGLALAGAAGSVTPAAADGLSVSPSADTEHPLHLVALTGPGLAGYRGPLPASYVAVAMLRRQDALLAEVGAPRPVYRWTTALNGFAVRLSPRQAAALRAQAGVELVERNAVRPLAAGPAPAAATVRGRERGGAGVVVALVDSGLTPESPLFADVPRLGRAPDGFGGGCAEGEDWPRETCNRKVVGARWFVEGFGTERLRSSSSLSPRDDDGHGTQVASIVAGNSGVSVRVGAQRLARYGGVAPQARIAVYKACWTAPDPRDDGCATADLVTAVDQAVADGVDVLNLSVGGPAEFDTLELALLGAAERGVVVVAAAGNDGGRYAAHPSPWVTTVGGTAGPQRRGAVVTAGGPALTGAMSAERGTRPARLVRAAGVAAPGADRDRARVCAPGSLDAAAVADRVVLCERGGVARVEKSRAVALADGVGMVLVNPGPGSTDADFHHVPTVHLGQQAAERLRAWLARDPDGRVSLHRLGTAPAPDRVLLWSSAGDPLGDVVKPDLVAPATGVLAAVPAAGRPAGWDLVAGTSAATAYTSGAAAVLLHRRPTWSAAAVRSALATTASRVAGPVLRAGAGRARAERADRPGLVHEVAPADYRRWLTGDLRGDLNTPSLLLSGGRATATRTVTNVTGRARYFSSGTTGFTGRVTVVPAAVRLAPGESATYTVTVADPGHPDDGYVVWRGGSGTTTRVPVVVGGR